MLCILTIPHKQYHFHLFWKSQSYYSWLVLVVLLITSNKRKTNTLCFIFFQQIHTFLLTSWEKKLSTLKAQTHNSRSVYLQCTDRAVNVDAGFVKILIVKVKTDWGCTFISPHPFMQFTDTTVYFLCPIKLRKS